MIQASKLAVEHVNAQGGLLGGKKLVAVVGDSACSQQGGTDAAAKVVNVEQVVAMVGPFCSGETLAAANSVTIPAGVVMISPSATSPRSEEHTSELQPLMRISYDVFCFKNNN